MTFRVLLTSEARSTLNHLAANDRAKHKRVSRTQGLMETDLRSQSLQTHEYQSLRGPNGEKVFEAYADTGADAYRVFWYYGPRQGEITVLAITRHP